MNYTPLSYLTDEEFMHHLAVKDKPTDEEIEAMVRIERLLEDKASNPKAAPTHVDA